MRIKGSKQPCWLVLSREQVNCKWRGGYTQTGRVQPLEKGREMRVSRKAALETSIVQRALVVVVVMAAAREVAPPKVSEWHDRGRDFAL